MLLLVIIYLIEKHGASWIKTVDTKKFQLHLTIGDVSSRAGL